MDKKEEEAHKEDNNDNPISPTKPIYLEENSKFRSELDEFKKKKKELIEKLPPPIFSTSNNEEIEHRIKMFVELSKK